MSGAAVKVRLLDADFVPCGCPTVRGRCLGGGFAYDGRPAEYVDNHSPQHSGTRRLVTLCCRLKFAIIPPGRDKPRGYTEVEPVRLVNGQVVRRLAVKP